MLLKTRAYDVFMIALIIMYTLLVFLFIGLEDVLFADECALDSNGAAIIVEGVSSGEMTFYIIELIILGIFVIEITLHIFSYHLLYLEDMWNLFDFIVIILSIVFVLLDMSLAGTNSALTGFLKIRGIFRLLRIFILIRKLNALRIKREA